MKISSKPLSDRRWIDEMVLELRLREVTGPAIGDATAAVESHCAESGQSAAEAFGDPREYARALEFAPDQIEHTSAFGWARVLFPVACGLIGMTATVDAVRGLKQGGAVPVTWGELAALVVCALVAATTLRIARVVMRHMLVGTLWFGGAIAVMAMLPILLDEPAFELPWWLMGACGLALLAVATARMSSDADSFADPVVDPRTGSDRYAARLPGPARAAARHATAWMFVIVTVVLGTVTWVLG